jgi:hypothetical protein
VEAARGVLIRDSDRLVRLQIKWKAL